MIGRPLSFGGVRQNVLGSDGSVYAARENLDVFTYAFSPFRQKPLLLCVTFFSGLTTGVDIFFA